MKLEGVLSLLLDPETGILSFLDGRLVLGGLLLDDTRFMLFHCGRLRLHVLNYDL